MQGGPGGSQNPQGPQNPGPPPTPPSTINPPPNPPTPPARKTHTSNEVIEALKDLSLKARLQKNKKIEEENEARLEYAVMRPAALITESRIQTIKISKIHLRVPPHSSPSKTRRSRSLPSLGCSNTSGTSSRSRLLPGFRVLSLPERQLLPTKENPRTTAPISSTSDSVWTAIRSKSGILERQRLSNSRISCSSRKRDPTSQSIFFQRRCLLYISANQAGGIPTTKGILLEGETGKHPSIIDIDALHKELGTTKGCLTYAQFLEAKDNMIEFQRLRDKDPNGGSWTALWKEHFGFFTSQDDAEKYYPSWKTIEAEMRFNWCATQSRESTAFYVTKWISMTATHELKIAQEELRAALNAASGGSSAQTQGRNAGAKGKGKSTNGNAQPFRKTGASCILCHDSNHTLHAHPASTTKFAASGKDLYAKYENSKLLTPGNKEICIIWNVHGDSMPRGPCSHGDARLHICSFCGDSNHHAHSGRCKNIQSS
ncbi:hypothetical protein BJ165DRAFT_1531795 [Panaeolus papilionaceus]|nr:hypothetical protein BJ165DRAFT_1531795 [Panaeolus papilionaceus]